MKIPRSKSQSKRSAPSSTPELPQELDVAQKALLAELLLSGASNADAAAELKKKCGVQMDSTALDAFWREVCEPTILARHKRTAGTAQRIEWAKLEKGASFESAAFELLAQRMVELLIRPNLDSTVVQRLYAFLLKHTDQEIDREKLRLEERRIALLEQRAMAEANANGAAPEANALSDEERRARYHRIFDLAQLAED